MDEEVKLKNNYHTIVETSFYNFLWYPKEFPVTTQPAGALIQGYMLRDAYEAYRGI